MDDGAAALSRCTAAAAEPLVAPAAVRHNLAESTTALATIGDLIDLIGQDELRALPLGYTEPMGLAALREEVARASGVPAEAVLTTHGAAFALFLLAFELCRPGDDVLITTPCYFVAHETLRRCGARVRTLGLGFEHSYSLDPARVAAELTPRTRLVSIASPHNPSGVHVPLESIRALLDLMAERAPGAVLLVDETFREASYGATPPQPSAAALDRRVVSAGSISKAYGVPGLRVGWLTLPDPTLRARLSAAKANTLVAASTLEEFLGAALMRRSAVVLAGRRAALAEGLALLAAWQRRVAALVDWVRPEAGALSCFRLRPDAFGPQAVGHFWDAVAAAGIELAPGTWFSDEDRVFRIGFGALPPVALGRALDALAEVMAALAET